MERERKIQGDVQKQKLNLENSSAELEFVTSGKSTEMKIDLRKFAVRIRGLRVCFQVILPCRRNLSRLAWLYSLTQRKKTKTASRCRNAAGLEAERLSCCDTPGDLQICLPAEERAGRKCRRHAEQTIFKEHSKTPLLQQPVCKSTVGFALNWNRRSLTLESFLYSCLLQLHH